MNPTAIHASPIAHGPRRRIVRGLAIGLVAAFVLAWVGAMGTGIAPFGPRLAYWLAVIMPGSLLGLAMTALVRGWGGLRRRPWAEIALVAFAVSLPHTFLVIVASALFFGVGTITPALVGNFWGAVLLLALVLTAVSHLAGGETAAPLSLPDPVPDGPSGTSTVAPAEPKSAVNTSVLPSAPELLAERLPVSLRGARLIAISAEDHYLRFHTDLGSNLVLMRMADACALLPDSAGARVHRSWWVARAAVEARVQDGGRMTLQLIGGLEAPVSRAQQAQMRREGWGA